MQEKRFFSADLDITDFGAVGDGKTDCTEAVQKALDSAAKTTGSVRVPAGVYKCGYVKMSEGCGLYGIPGSSVFVFNGANAPCLIDISDAYGAVIEGLTLDGGFSGNNVNGIMLDRKDIKSIEDTSHIGSCHIHSFTGDGLHYNKIWCDSARHNVFENNGRYGMYVNGFDCFFYDNVFRRNGKAGLGCNPSAFHSTTVTGNRFEYNGGPGLLCYSINLGSCANNVFTGNEGPGLCILDRGQMTNATTVTSNLFSGNAGTYAPGEEYMSCHIYMESCTDTNVSGNSFIPSPEGKDPLYCITHRKIWAVAFTGNACGGGMRKDFFMDRGGHGGYIIKEDNIALTRAAVAAKEAL